MGCQAPYSANKHGRGLRELFNVDDSGFPTYLEILEFIETNGVRDETGGYSIFQDKTIANMMGVLLAQREQPGQCFEGQTVSVHYRPEHGTPEHHAETCRRLVKDRPQDEILYFPTEALRHLRLAAGVPSTKTGEAMSIPDPVLSALQDLESKQTPDRAADTLDQLGFTEEVLEYCERHGLLQFGNEVGEDPLDGPVRYWVDWSPWRGPHDSRVRLAPKARAVLAEFRLVQPKRGNPAGKTRPLEWTPPPGYVGRKTICRDQRFQKNGKNPPATTIDVWVRSSESAGTAVRIEVDPANRENYYPKDWVMQRIARWNPRPFKRKPGT